MRRLEYERRGCHNSILRKIFKKIFPQGRRREKDELKDPQILEQANKGK